MTIHTLAHKLTVSHLSVILSVLLCQLAPKSNSHISQSFVVSVYKPAFFQCIFSSSSYMYSNVSRSTYVHLRLFHSKRIQYSTNMGTTGMWRPHRDNVETMWGPWGCGDNIGTTWSQHEDNVETTWGPRECGDHMGTT